MHFQKKSAGRRCSGTKSASHVLWSRDEGVLWWSAQRFRRSLIGPAVLAVILAPAGAISVHAQADAPANAQQAPSQPPLNPSQIERNIDAQEAERKRAKRSPVQIPTVARPEIPTDTKPMFKLTGVSVMGASVLPNDAIAETYRPYIGSTVSKADLATIAAKIGAVA